MASAEPAEDRPVKDCVLCGLEIPLMALKCFHCDSFQDWRKHLPFSSTVLSLLVALFSVLTVGAPVLEKLIAPPDELVRIAITGFSVSFMSMDHYRGLLGIGPVPRDAPLPPTEVSLVELQLLAINVGSKVGVVTDVEVDGIEITSNNGKTRTVSALTLSDKVGSSGAFAVAPNESKLVRGFITDAGSFRTDKPFKLRIGLLNAKGEKVSRIIDAAPL